jgi:hypothetical protein
MKPNEHLSPESALGITHYCGLCCSARQAAGFCPPVSSSSSIGGNYYFRAGLQLLFFAQACAPFVHRKEKVR